MRREILVVAILLAAGAPAMAATGVAFERHVERLVATPTPIGPVLVLSDRASWDVTLDAATILWVEAQAPDHSPFYLTTDCGATFVTLPSSHDGRLCGKPGTWRVSVDPAGGAAVDITVRFRGHVGDLTGAPSPFTLTDVAADRGCVVLGACLP